MCERLYRQQTVFASLIHTPHRCLLKTSTQMPRIIFKKNLNHSKVFVISPATFCYHMLVKVTALSTVYPVKSTCCWLADPRCHVLGVWSLRDSRLFPPFFYTSPAPQCPFSPPSHFTIPFSPSSLSRSPSPPSHTLTLQPQLPTAANREVIFMRISVGYGRLGNCGNQPGILQDSGTERVGGVGKQVLEEVEGLEERGNVDGGIECQAAPASGRQQQQQLQQRQGQTVAAR